MRWLPGLGDEEAGKLYRDYKGGGATRLSQAAPLAETNLLLTGLETQTKAGVGIAGTLVTIAWVWEKVDHVAVTQQINKHRQRAGMKAKATEEKVKLALEEHESRMTEAIKSALDSLPTLQMIKTMRWVCEITTGLGKKRAPRAVRKWGERYEKECGDFFREQVKVVEKIATRTSRAAKSGNKERARELTQRFIEAVIQWDLVAQPVQLIRQGEGVTDVATSKMFETTRDLAITLHNEARMTDLSLLITKMQKRVFAEAEKLEGRIEEDHDQLEAMVRK